VNSGRRYYYRNATPEQRENQREYQRIWSEGKRRRQGTPVTLENRKRVTDRPEYVYLDTGPLLREIDRLIEADGELQDLATMSGVSERAIYRLRSGESRHVRIDNADKLAVALGLTLELIYEGDGVNA
jgi:DNA-binding Xre family transcriptional regulator